MRLRKSPGGSVRATSAFELAALFVFAATLIAQAPAPGVPLLVVLDTEPQRWPARQGWLRLEPKLEGLSDQAFKTLERQVIEQVQAGKADSTRMYVAGRAEYVFYAVSRLPDLWAAAAAVGGDPKAAVISGKLYAANSQLIPLLWADTAMTPQAQKMASAKFRMDRRKATEADALEFLAAQRREELPYKVECETGSPAFARCYWLQMTKFDPSRRNDVLRSTRVPPGSGATLALGSFGFPEQDKGPGVLMQSLPDGYKGPLKTGDRIVSVGGTAIEDAAAYVALMDEMKEEKPVAIMVQRGKQRIRVETGIMLPKREEAITAHVRAEFSMDTKDLIVSTRTVTELRLLIPANWAGAAVNWNGNEVLKDAAAGCWVLSETPSPSASPCR